MRKIKSLLFVLFLLLSSLLFAQYTFAQTAKLPKNKNSAIIPKEKTSKWWQNRHARKLEEIKGEKRDAQIVFIGNSITHNLEKPGSKEIWEKYFGKYNPLNLGFGADRTENVLWRITKGGELKGLHPKLAVILIGTNNTDAEHYPTTNSGAEVAEGIVKICREVQAQLPETKVLILAIFPFGKDPDNKRRADNSDASRLAAKIANGKTVFYADLTSNFVNPDGTIDTSIMPDYLHPSVAGNWIWAKSLYPVVEQIMNMK
jgi:beta-glucosidase